MAACFVCVESGRPLVACPCGFGACAPCTKRFFASRPDVPSCMSCRRAFDAQFLLQYFSHAYVHAEIEDARRESVVRADEAYQLQTMEHVMPLVGAYERAYESFFEAQGRAREAYLEYMVAARRA